MNPAWHNGRGPGRRSREESAEEGAERLRRKLAEANEKVARLAVLLARDRGDEDEPEFVI